MTAKRKIILGVSGASGAVYALAHARSAGPRRLRDTPLRSERAATSSRSETGLRLAPNLADLAAHIDAPLDGVRWVAPDDIAAAVCSGSALFDGMAVVPCSMRTLGAIASGCGDNALHRAADVTLKQRRPLVLVPRETPTAPCTLRNMLELAHAGATVLPACPGFYHDPQSVADLVDFVVARCPRRARRGQRTHPAMARKMSRTAASLKLFLRDIRPAHTVLRAALVIAATVARRAPRALHSTPGR